MRPDYRMISRMMGGREDGGSLGGAAVGGQWDQLMQMKNEPGNGSAGIGPSHADDMASMASQQAMIQTIASDIAPLSDMT